MRHTSRGRRTENMPVSCCDILIAGRSVSSSDSRRLLVVTLNCDARRDMDCGVVVVVSALEQASVHRDVDVCKQKRAKPLLAGS